MGDSFIMVAMIILVVAMVILPDHKTQEAQEDIARIHQCFVNVDTSTTMEQCQWLVAELNLKHNGE